MILQDQGSRPVVWASCFQRIGRRPKDRDFCWSCPFKSTKNQAPAATSMVKTFWRTSTKTNIYHPGPSIIQKGQDLKNIFFFNSCFKSQKKNSWFLGWRFIPNINTVPTLQGPQLPRVTTCEAPVTRIPGSNVLLDVTWPLANPYC